jgi:hypothetical protein
MSRACHEWASTWQAGCPQVLFGMQFLLVVRGCLDIRMDDRMKNKVLGLVRLGRLDDALKDRLLINDPGRSGVAKLVHAEHGLVNLPRVLQVTNEHLCRPIFPDLGRLGLILDECAHRKAFLVKSASQDIARYRLRRW